MRYRAAVEPRWLTLLLLCGLPCWLKAAPEVTGVSLRGLQIGGTTTLTIDGSDLLPNPSLLAPFPIASQTVKPGAQPNHVEIEVQLDDQLQPGIYQLRWASDKGVSNAIAIGLDRLEQRPFNAQVERLPVAFHGRVTGTDVLRTRFHGQRGMKLVVDVESQRLGGKLKPVVRVKDARGRQLAWNSTARQLAGDARVMLELPTDGEYTVELHDVLYRSADPGFFRLKLGELQYADLVFPLGVQLGQRTTLQLAAANLGGTTPFDATSLLTAGRYPAALTGAPLFSGSLPQVSVSPYPEVVESGPKQDLPAAPVAVSGRISQAGEEDQFVLPVTPGAQLRFDVVAQRVHSALDGVLSLRNAQGAQLAANDDQSPSADPGLDFTIPPDTQQLIVALRDVAGRGGPDFVYRIVVTDTSLPEVRLQTDTDRINVPAGATQTLKLRIDRSNYQGPVELTMQDLPPGIQLAGQVIPAEATSALLTMTAPPDSSPSHGLTRLLATMNDQRLPRVVLALETDVSKYLPWLREDWAWSVTQPAPVSIAWSATSDAQLPLGYRLSLPVTVRRAEGVTGSVRLRLLTTQAMPRKKIKENNQEKEVDDLDRALRLESEPVLAPDVPQATVQLLVPADLPRREWGLVLAADLLAADNKTTLATTTTILQSKQPFVPFTVELTSAGPVDAKAGLGDTGKLTGKLVRLSGFDQALTVTLGGLPKEYPPPSVVVPPDKQEFELPVRFPFGSKPAELKDVTLTVIYRPNPASAELAVRANELPVSLIRVVPGEPPPADPLLTIFEDDAKFVELLSKGGGTIQLDKEAKYSGSASVRVTPDQRFNETLPMLSVKIREQPAPGEFRFLRFAWKKMGGSSVCLQLNHDGQWGPGGSGKPGAKFRYHAGGGGECYGASLMVDEKLPTEFVVVTRDLFADFGEFTLTGLALSPVDGDYALYDQLYLGRSAADFDKLKASP